MENRKPRLNTQIYEEACDKFLECRTGESSDSARLELDRWLRKSPENLRAYLEIAAIWNEAPSLDPASMYDAARLIEDAARDPDNVVALSSNTLGLVGAVSREVVARVREPFAEAVQDEILDIQHSGVAQIADRRVQANAGWTRRLAMAASAAGIGIATLVVFSLLAIRTPTYVTAIGEQRSLVLPDRSTVILNSRSKIRVRYSTGERNVNLIDGQAFFHVAKDSKRPFIVKSGDTQVRAVGTEFDVYRKEDGTIVTVVEGQVAVLAAPLNDSGLGRSVEKPSRPTSGTDLSVPASLPFPAALGRKAENIFVSAGEQLRVTRQATRKAEHENVAIATAWTQRQLVFESASLSEVAHEFNRYNERQLVLQKPGLDSFHVSGAFSSTDPASLIRFLKTRPGLRVVETPSEIRIESLGQ